MSSGGVFTVPLAAWETPAPRPKESDMTDDRGHEHPDHPEHPERPDHPEHPPGPDNPKPKPKPDHGRHYG